MQRSKRNVPEIVEQRVAEVSDPLPKLPLHPRGPLQQLQISLCFTPRIYLWQNLQDTKYPEQYKGIKQNVQNITKENESIPYLVCLKSANSSFLQVSNPGGYLTRWLTFIPTRI
mgnify:FL=1